MKACICNVPIRGRPTTVPPFGSIYIIQALKRIGWDVDFYNTDYFRPGHEQIVDYFSSNQFDLVGISAVVSTGYEFTKYLSELIREISPNTLIVVGGNMAANAELILKKTNMDICVIGDGEVTIQEVVKLFEEGYISSGKDKRSWDFERLSEVKGICYHDSDGKFHFTGDRLRIPGDQLDWPDYSILEAEGSVEHYFNDAESWFEAYGLEIPKKIIGKKSAWVPTAKGCNSRCTFCHRFTKGYRMRSREQIIDHIEYVRDRYNVGLFLMFDESFGADRRRTEELVEHFGEMGLLWAAGSVRAKSINTETLKTWYKNGCRMVTYGIESGSQTMLDVMEKNAKVDDNIEALKATHATGLVTSVQLVLGMPGETDRTINETIDFLKKTMPYYHIEGRGRLESEIAAFYAQALPSTPLYEYYREHGLIGSTLDDEEKYLIGVSNVDALNISHYINGTKQPLLRALLWRDKIFRALYKHYLKEYHGFSSYTLSWVLHEAFYRTIRNKVRPKFKNIFPTLFANMSTPLEVLIGEKLGENLNSDEEDILSDPSYYIQDDNKSKVSAMEPTLYQVLTFNKITHAIVYPMKLLQVATMQSKNPFKILYYLFEYALWIALGEHDKADELPSISLRKVVAVHAASDGSDAAIPLRKGK